MTYWLLAQAIRQLLRTAISRKDMVVLITGTEREDADGPGAIDMQVRILGTPRFMVAAHDAFGKKIKEALGVTDDATRKTG